MLGLPVATDVFNPQIVEHNGFRFWFSAYNDPNLRMLQFYFLESELRQAIGRARVNTELCTVTLYSNYPLLEACITDEEKENGLQRLALEKSKSVD